ncbi:MAG: hypothetical protein ABFD13_06335, partial [Candidatus Cryosericum sp.]
MRTFLFDLDGTLLAMDEHQFMQTYFGELTRALHGLVPAEGLATADGALTGRGSVQPHLSAGCSTETCPATRSRAPLLFPSDEQAISWRCTCEYRLQRPL